MTTASYDGFLRLLGVDDSEALRAWHEATLALPKRTDVVTLVLAWRWAIATRDFAYADHRDRVARLVEAGLTHHLSPDVLEFLNDIYPQEQPAEFLQDVFRRERALSTLDLSTDDHFASGMIASAERLASVLTTLRENQRSPIGRRLLEVFPELAALCVERDDHVTVEHERLGEARFPLLDHLVERSVARKLVGLELRDIRIFQRDEALSPAAFDAESQVVADLAQEGLMPIVRAALCFLDFTKGGTSAQRRAWQDAGADLSIHNEASAHVLTHFDVLRRFPRFRADPLQTALAHELVRVHGVTGQVIRGECPLSVFASFATWLRDSQADLAASMGVDPTRAIDSAVDMLHVINACDTAGVREGLYTDSLRFEFVAVESLIRRVARDTQLDPDVALSAREAFGAADPREAVHRKRQWLIDRLLRLRAGRTEAGEPSEEAVRVVTSLSDDVLDFTVELLSKAQLWYVEAATASLSPGAQLTLLTCALVQAHRDPSIDTSHLFHITFLPLLRDLGRDEHAAAPYRVRLIEALLRRTDLDAVVRGADPMPDDALGSFEVELGRGQALAVRFDASAEANALLTLLPMYERKSSVAFHATLKTLCDLYGLRKDDFDRLANEDAYLVHMNSARSDKDRMLDHAVPGRVVEIGPGGGVVLDLLEARFPKSDIVGVDVSRVVVETLHARRERENRRWRVIEADAFALDKHLEPGTVTTIVLCSVLHEIYSYVEVEIDGRARKFRLESVRDLLRACYRTLAPGGRIIIRDGIMPPDEPRIIEFIDPEGPEFFRMFQEQFEGRPIRGEWIDAKRLRIGAADAMEFLYCYTWGPASFPYEVREQYGVLPYEEYTGMILAWLANCGDSPAQLIDLPPHEASYLQSGYNDGLASKIRLYDGAFQAVALPDSNALMVFEKPA